MVALPKKSFLKNDFVYILLAFGVIALTSGLSLLYNYIEWFLVIYIGIGLWGLLWFLSIARLIIRVWRREKPYYRTIIVFIVVTLSGILVPIAWFTPHIVHTVDYSRNSSTYHAQLIDQGRPIVNAIYKYKEDNGNWPMNLSILVPAYLKSDPSLTGWYYWGHASGFTLSIPAGGFKDGINYEHFPNTTDGWYYGDDGGGEDRLIEAYSPERNPLPSAD